MSSFFLHFPPFRLDPSNERLWNETQEIPLRPKTFAVLRYLVEHAEQLVTKDELMRAVWPDIVVGDDALTGCIRDLRKVLGDEAKTPRYIETVHGRGYRFIGKVASSQHSVVSSPPPPTQHSGLSFQHSVLVGREAELAQLHQWWAKALAGERQLVFISGEAGIGKTSVVEAFLARITRGHAHEHEHEIWVGRGQCIEHYGAGEGYMPVLEALGRLCREPGGGRLIEFLGQHAPTWLVQMPALLSATEREKLQREVAGATRERMLREMAEALEALTSERPLVLRLEDLHWSDVSTLELLAVLARHHEAARLLVLGTYRPVEMLANGHPLRTVRQELQLHRQCEEQRLGLLSEEHVVEYLAAQGRVKESVESIQIGIPGDLRQMIEEQIHRVSTAERRVLEVASIAGAEFSAAAVAAGLGVAVEEVEEQCEGLVRREQFLRAREPVEWPDGTIATRYQFLHALYQEVFYERIAVARRSRLHRLLGERTEAAYGKRASEIAAELAVHFERGRDYRRAVQYLQHAGENALRRSANQEAVNLLTKGLELLKTLPDTPERAQQELTLQITLGVPLMTIKGYAAPEVEQTYARARELCPQVGETLQLFPVLRGLWNFHFIRAEFRTTRELAEQLLTLAQSEQDQALLPQAYLALGTTLYMLGELVPAREHIEQSLALYDSQKHRLLAFLYPTDGVASLSYAAWGLWVLGYPDQALQRSREALTVAQELAHPFSLAFALGCVANLHLLRREGEAVKERAEAGMALSTEHGFPFWLARGAMLRGWALAEQSQVKEGIAQMQQGLAALRAMGAEQGRPSYLAQLARAYGQMGQAEEGLAAVAEALATVNKTGERISEAELYRLKGELTLKQFGVRSPEFGVTNPQSPTPNPQTEAEACFHKALEIARRQSAKSLELRATVSLARLWQQQDKKKQARKLLAKIYGWFTEGFDTKDLQEAKALLAELA